MDVRDFTISEFNKALLMRGAGLEDPVLDVVYQAFAFDQVQQVVNQNLTRASDKRRRGKIHKKELGKLSRGFANCVANEVISGSAGGEAVKAAFDRWRSSRSFSEIAKRYHLTPNTLACRQELQAA